MSKRKEFSKSVKLARFEFANGCCEQCGQRIIGIAEYDHAIEDYVGGEPTFTNCVCLCRKCHGAKTKRSRPQIDKTRRVLEKRAGVRKTRGFQKPPANFNTWTRQWE